MGKKSLLQLFCHLLSLKLVLSHFWSYKSNKIHEGTLILLEPIVTLVTLMEDKNSP